MISTPPHFGDDRLDSWFWDKCMPGHEYTDDNTYKYKGKRICATCAYAKVKRRRARRQGAPLSAH